MKEESASAEASADAELWRDLPSSDYSESLRELAGLASKTAQGRRRKEKEKWEVRTERLGGAT